MALDAACTAIAAGKMSVLWRRLQSEVGPGAHRREVHRRKRSPGTADGETPSHRGPDVNSYIPERTLPDAELDRPPRLQPQIAPSVHGTVQPVCDPLHRAAKRQVRPHHPSSPRPGCGVSQARARFLLEERERRNRSRRTAATSAFALPLAGEHAPKALRVRRGRHPSTVRSRF
jgi:hypothetical protein